MTKNRKRPMSKQEYIKTLKNIPQELADNMYNSYLLKFMSYKPTKTLQEAI